MRDGSRPSRHGDRRRLKYSFPLHRLIDSWQPAVAQRADSGLTVGIQRADSGQTEADCEQTEGIQRANSDHTPSRERQREADRGLSSFSRKTAGRKRADIKQIADRH